MDSCSHPCGNSSISPCTQGVERPFPGNGRDGRVACQESTALSPRCAQMRGVYAHVIHRFIHRPAWLDAPGTTQTTSQAVSSRHRSLPHGGPRCWLSWATTGACCAPWPARTTTRESTAPKPTPPISAGWLARPGGCTHDSIRPIVGDDALRRLSDILTVRLIGRRDRDRGYTVPAAGRGGRVTRRPAMGTAHGRRRARMAQTGLWPMARQDPTFINLVRTCLAIS